MASQDQNSSDKELGVSYLIRHLHESIDKLEKRSEELERITNNLQRNWDRLEPQIATIVKEKEDTTKRWKDLTFRILQILIISLLAGGVLYYLGNSS